MKIRITGELENNAFYLYINENTKNTEVQTIPTSLPFTLIDIFSHLK